MRLEAWECHRVSRECLMTMTEVFSLICTSMEGRLTKGLLSILYSIVALPRRNKPRLVCLSIKSFQSSSTNNLKHRILRTKKGIKSLSNKNFAIIKKKPEIEDAAHCFQAFLSCTPIF